MTDPFVSVVSPVYNGEKYLKNCLQGVVNQTFKNFEYIILDNASTDGTKNIIKEFAESDDRIKVFRNPSTLKIIDNWNESLKYVSPDSKWIKFAFADDRLFPNCVEEMVRVGEKDPSIGFVSSMYLRGRNLANIGLPMEQEIADGKEMLKQHILRKLHVCLDSPNTVMYRKAVLSKLGGFDNTYMHADTELAFRILYRYNLGFVHQVLSWTGINRDSGSNYAHFHGLITREYLKFGFKEIHKYEDISFKRHEIESLSDYYADEIARYILTHMVYFLWKDIRNLWLEAPREVKKRMFAVLRKKWPIYSRKFIGSIIHYKKRIENTPTFKG